MLSSVQSHRDIEYRCRQCRPLLTKRNWQKSLAMFELLKFFLNFLFVRVGIYPTQNKKISYLPNIANASIARYIKPIITDEKIAKENGIGRRTSTKNITSIVDQSDSFFIKSRNNASLSITPTPPTHFTNVMALLI